MDMHTNMDALVQHALVLKATLEEHWLGLLGLFAAFLLFHFVIYPLFLSPLSNIPGPKLAALSSWYLNSRYILECGSSHIEELHRQYGPIVRVGPSEVVVNDVKHLPTIYGVSSNFPKPPASEIFKNFGYPCAFSSRHKNEHRERRKVTAKIYTMSTVLGNTLLKDFIQDRLDKVVELIDQKAGAATDLFSLAIRFALDNVSYIVFGGSFMSLDGQNLEAASFIRNAAVVSTPVYRLWDSLIGNILLSTWPFNRMLPTDLQTALSGNFDDLDKVVKKNFDQSVVHSSEPSRQSSAFGCMYGQATFGKKLLEGHVLSECCDHIGAGADTTGASIIYMMHTLALPENQKYQDRLREEIMTLSYPFSFKDVCNLPFMECCSREILRIRSPGPGNIQQRYTPTSTTLTIGDKVYHLPENTQIGTQAFSLHRSVDIYGDDANEFRPERWETGDEQRLRIMKDAWIPFGYGSRICLGMNLAIVELKVITATLVRLYNVGLPDGANRKDMDPILGAVIRPKSGKCDLVFERR